eukprot:TRINITY_DN21160_c0_g1_i1.p2 TRINITY_DN21160_c0_g1~~TRINITY_DN21160_c0_g1_i1.p2  ORF type:complete len:332 (+),score=47.70 TRINITY_DN21160_c0_g1_i1:61-996(+)
MQPDTRSALDEKLNLRQTLEGRIVSLRCMLETTPAGVSNPLVDREGFPRDDCDLTSVREWRHALARAVTDLRVISEEIAALAGMPANPIVLNPDEDAGTAGEETALPDTHEPDVMAAGGALRCSLDAPTDDPCPLSSTAAAAQSIFAAVDAKDGVRRTWGVDDAPAAGSSGGSVGAPEAVPAAVAVGAVPGSTASGGTAPAPDAQDDERLLAMVAGLPPIARVLAVDPAGAAAAAGLAAGDAIVSLNFVNAHWDAPFDAMVRMVRSIPAGRVVRVVIRRGASSAVTRLDLHHQGQGAVLGARVVPWHEETP